MNRLLNELKELQETKSNYENQLSSLEDLMVEVSYEIIACKQLIEEESLKESNKDIKETPRPKWENEWQDNWAGDYQVPIDPFTGLPKD